MKDMHLSTSSERQDEVGKSVQTDAIKSERESTTRLSSEPMAMSFNISSTVKSGKKNELQRRQKKELGQTLEQQQEIEIQEQVRVHNNMPSIKGSSNMYNMWIQNSQSSSLGEESGEPLEQLFKPSPSSQIPAVAQQRRPGSRQTCRGGTLVSNLQSQLRQLQLSTTTQSRGATSGSQLSIQPTVSRIAIPKKIDSQPRMIQRKKAITNIPSERPASNQLDTSIQNIVQTLTLEERPGVSLGSPRYNNANPDFKSISNRIPAVANRARTDRRADRFSKFKCVQQAQGWYKYRQTLAQPDRELATKIISIQDLPNGIQVASTKETAKSRVTTQPKGRIRNFKTNTNIHYKTQDELGVFGSTLRQREDNEEEDKLKQVKQVTKVVSRLPVNTINSNNADFLIANFDEEDRQEQEQDSYFQKELHDFHQQNIEEFNYRETLTREDYLRKKNLIVQTTAARGSISAEKEVELKDMEEALRQQIDAERSLGPAYSSPSLPFGRKDRDSGAKTPEMAANTYTSSRSYLGFFDSGLGSRGLTPLKQRLYNDSPIIDITQQRAQNDSRILIDPEYQHSHNHSRVITEPTRIQSQQPTFRSKDQKLVKQQIIKVVGKVNKGDKRNIAIKCMENFQQNLASDENTIMIFPQEVDKESEQNKIQTPSIANTKPSAKSQRSDLQKLRAQTQQRNRSEVAGSRLLTNESKAQKGNLSLKELVSKTNNEQVFQYQQLENLRSQSIMKSKLRQKMLVNGVHRMFQEQSAIVPKQMVNRYRGSRSKQEDKKFWITTQSIVKQRDLKHTNNPFDKAIPLKKRGKHVEERGKDQLNQTANINNTHNTLHDGRSQSAMFGALGQASSYETIHTYTMRPLVNLSSKQNKYSTQILNSGTCEKYELLKEQGFPLQKTRQNDIIMKSFDKSQRSMLKSAFDSDVNRTINLPQPQLENEPDVLESQAVPLALKELAPEQAATTENANIKDADPTQATSTSHNVLERLELLEKLRASAEQWSTEKKPRKAEKKARSFMNFVSLPSSLTKDKYYQTLLLNKNKFGEQKVVPNILDLIKTPDTNDLSFEQLALVQNFFDNHIYTDLLKNLLQDLANNKVHSSIITFLKYLPLNLEFVEKIMKYSKVCGFLRPYNSKQKPSQMYFIHAGCVDVFDAQSKRIITTLGKGQIFKVDSQIDQRRKYRARKENDEPIVILEEEHENFPFVFLNKLALIQFDLGNLAKIFIDQIKSNLDENKECLLGFSIFYCLGREKLSYLAQRALRAEYADEEVILEEGTLPMDKVFLILKGHVKVSCSSGLPAGKGSLNARELVLGPGEHFGLREMLYENGRRGGFPSLRRYTADCSSGTPPTVMAIHAHDFLEVMPQDEVANLMTQHDVASLAELAKGETYKRALQKLSNNRLRHELGFSRAATASQYPREYKITLKSQSMNKQ